MQWTRSRQGEPRALVLTNTTQEGYLKILVLRMEINLSDDWVQKNGGCVDDSLRGIRYGDRACSHSAVQVFACLLPSGQEWPGNASLACRQTGLLTVVNIYTNY